MRILMYSHDSFGLGHFRRSLTLAEALIARHPAAEVVLATGSPCATQFSLPERVEVVKLPSVGKDAEGRYVSRALRCSLPTILDLRQALLLELFRGLMPDLILVDHKVVGLCGELLPVLRSAKAAGVPTLLGLRDVIDEPDVVAREWGVPEVRHALASLYDRVVVYGTPELFDTRREYPIPPELSRRVEFVGYVVRDSGAGRLAPLPAAAPQVLVTVGGGEDAATRLSTYLDALELAPAPWTSRVLLGPLLESGAAKALRRRARSIEGVTAHNFHADVPRLLSESDAAVAMAGYNTTAEIMHSGVPAVLLPRTMPRREQALRAERLERLGLCEQFVEPQPATLRAAVERALSSPRRGHCALPMDGADKLCDLVVELTRRGAADGASTLVHAGVA